MAKVARSTENRNFFLEDVSIEEFPLLLVESRKEEEGKKRERREGKEEGGCLLACEQLQAALLACC